MNSKPPLRPEDRRGIKPGSVLSKINVGVYRVYSKLWRRLPEFRGKCRIAKEFRSLLKIENHHLIESTDLKRPTAYKAILDLHSQHEFFAYFTGGYESETVKFLTKCYQDNGYFLDIGANIGLISIPFALMANQSTAQSGAFVFTIEAIKSNQERLQENIAMNGLAGKIVPINYGVAEQEKTVEIQIEGNLEDGGGTGTANILADNTSHPAQRVTLQVTTIDKLIESGVLSNECSLIKIDLDGYDLKALQGAGSLLSISRPVIYGEFSAHCMNWHGQTHKDVENYMSTFDYTVFYRNKSTWQFSKVSSSDGDLLIIPTEKLADFAWCCELD